VTDRLLRRAPLLTLLLYAGATVFYTRPLLLHMTNAIAGGGIDGWNFYWDYWWTPFALFNLHQTPFHTDWIFYQSGTSLYFHTLQSLGGLMAAPFQFIGLAFADNVVTLLSYLLAGWFTYLLARLLLQQYVGNAGGEAAEGDNQSSPSGRVLLVEAAAFVAGFAFAFASPWRLQYLYAGQGSRLGIEWVPLFLYFAYRAYLRQSWKDAVFAGLSVVAAALTELQYVVYITIIVVILLLVELVVRGWRAWWRPALYIAGAGVLAVVLLSPILLQMYGELSHDPTLIPTTSATVLHSADLLELFAPNRSNLIWGGLAGALQSPVYDKYPMPGAFSPPYIILGLAIVGVVLTWRRAQTKVLLACGLTFLLISYGPMLHINGKDTFTAYQTNIPMPYAVLYYLPFMQVSRDPERFGEMAYLFWCLLAAVGCFALVEWYGARTGLQSQAIKGWQAIVVPAVVVLLAGIEFITITPPIDRVDTPPFYQQLANDKANYAIMELPIYKGGDEDHWFSYQAAHHKYLLGGDLARKQSYPFAEYTPVLNWFWAQQVPGKPDIVPDPPLSAGLDVLRWANIHYAVLIKQAVVGQDLPSANALIKAVWGPNAGPSYSDTIMDVYSVPPASATETATIAYGPMLALGGGWYNYEGNGSSGHRWISGDEGNREATITTLNLGPAAPYTLTFDAASYAMPRQVEVTYGDEKLATLDVGLAEQTYTLPLTVPSGRQVLTFRPLGEPTSPQSIGQGKDVRPLSVNFGNFAIAPAQ
jgi:hypothetical protein